MLRELSLRQLNLLEVAPPVTGLLALRRISLQVRCQHQTEGHDAVPQTSLAARL